MKRRVPKGLVDLTRRRADGRCEYCRIPESFLPLPHVIDHIIAAQHLGETTADNLALCCGTCNRHKGPNVGGVDRESGEFTRLYHPRNDGWADHFEWDGARVVARTPIGRVTVLVLDMNDELQLTLRRAAMKEGALPDDFGKATVRT